MQGKWFVDVCDGVYPRSDYGAWTSVHRHLYGHACRAYLVWFLLWSDYMEGAGIRPSGTGCGRGLRMALKLENLGITGAFGEVPFCKPEISSYVGTMAFLSTAEPWLVSDILGYIMSQLRSIAKRNFGRRGYNPTGFLSAEVPAFNCDTKALANCRARVCTIMHDGRPKLKNRDKLF